MKWSLPLAAAVTALALGASPASALSPGPTELSFDAVPVGTPIQNVSLPGGVTFSIRSSSTTATCSGSIVAEPTGHRALRGTCTAGTPVLRVTFAQVQGWIGLKVSDDSVPVYLEAFYPSGANYGWDSQLSLTPDPPRPGPWSPPVSISSGGSGAKVGYVELSPYNSATRPLTIRTVAVSPVEQPDLAITSTPPRVSPSATATFTFAASTPGPVFRCQIDNGTIEPCTSPYTRGGLSEGSHSMRVYVIGDDYAGATNWEYAYWTVDTIPPETSVSVYSAGSPYAEGAVRISPYANDTVRYECALDGGPFGPCPPNNVYAGLAVGPHSVLVRAIDDAGNVDGTPASASWIVRGATPRAVFDPAGPPQAGRSSTVSVLDGDVLVLVPGQGFVRLSGAANIPVGATVDARKGTLAVTTAADFLPAGNPRHKTQSARLSAGIFRILQRRARNGTANTDLALQTPAGAETACAAGRPAPAKGVVRSLSGTVKGTFRAVGAAAAATVRNATWTIEDTCRGTRIRVARGSVSVYDKARKRTVRIKAGRSYLIKARLFGAKKLR